MSTVNWDMIITVFGIVLGANGAFEFLKFLIQRSDTKRTSPERQALKALVADRLYVLLCDWKHNSGGMASEWETIDSLYTGYKALKGNGEISKLYDECHTLPTTD